LFELVLAADRSYMLDLPEDEANAPVVALSLMNFGAYPMVNQESRIATHYCGDPQPVEAARSASARGSTPRRLRSWVW